MTAIATAVFSGTPNVEASPLLICSAPSPRETAAPKVVRKTTKASTAREGALEEGLPGSTIELSRLGRPLRNIP